MWRTMRLQKSGTARPQLGRGQLVVGLPSAGAYRSHAKAGLPSIHSAQALPGRSNRCNSHIARSTASQDGSDNNVPAAPLVPTPQQQNGNLSAVPSTAGGPSTVPVQFVVPEYLTHWGQVLKVVGSLEELGSWKVEKAPSMQWNEGHTWTLDVQLPVGAVNFKIVMHDSPNSSTRWEEGEDRSVLIPETTTVSGAPVGQVGVTCNFNDVHNSRVEVRPDRAYLKQQLKAVEARVMAIQEKKRKLDQRMSVLTDGLKKYDSTVALIADGVSAAVEARRSSKEAKQTLQQPQQQQIPQQQQQQQQQQQAAPASSNGVPVSQQQQKQQQEQSGSLPPRANVNNSRADSFQVPILNPADLPSFADPPAAAAEAAAAAYAAAEQAEAAAAAAAAEAALSSSSSSMDADQQAADAAADADALLPVISSSSSSMSTYSADVGAIKASHVNETVLSATVDQLLAAAEDALDRSMPGELSGVPNMISIGTAGVDDVLMAEEYVEELLAAASALEQQADRRASLLLEAAQQAGDSDMAADIQQLASVELPPIPTIEELHAAADAAESASTVITGDVVQGSSAQEAVSDGSVSISSISSEDESTAPAQPQQQQQPQQIVLQIQPENFHEQQQERPSTPSSLDRDGSITFSAESLSVDVDVQQLLATVLSRVGIPLTAPVTISASFTPKPPPAAGPQQPAAAAAADDIESAAESSMDRNVETMGVDSTKQQQQQQQQQTKRPLSPVEAIAAVLSRGSSIDSDDESDSSSSSSSRSAPNGSSSSIQGFRMSSSNGTQGRYSRTEPSAGKGFGKASVRTSSSNPAAGAAAAPAAVPSAQSAVWSDPHEASKVLQAKEAARKAAADRVAAALAQVEEMRRSVVAANSMLRRQLGGATNSSSSRATVVGTSAVTSGDDSLPSSSGSRYSKYRVAYAETPEVADAAAGPGSSSSSDRQQQGAAGVPDPISAPGSPRGLPAIAATAVEPGLAADASSSSAAQQQQQGRGEMSGVVREEMSLLAALAAAVQEHTRGGRQ